MNSLYPDPWNEIDTLLAKVNKQYTPGLDDLKKLLGLIIQKQKVMDTYIQDLVLNSDSVE